MTWRTFLSGLICGSAGTAIAFATGDRITRSDPGTVVRIGTGTVLRAVAGLAIDAAAQLAGRVATMESLMPQTQVTSSYSQVLKPTPPTLFTDCGTGTDFETRLSALQEYLTPNDHFYIRSHSPTPELDVKSWRLSIDGTGVKTPLDLSHEELSAMPQTTVTRVIECAGNGRRFFKEAFGVEGEGSQWRTCVSDALNGPA